MTPDPRAVGTDGRPLIVSFATEDGSIWWHNGHTDDDAAYIRVYPTRLMSGESWTLKRRDT